MKKLNFYILLFNLFVTPILIYFGVSRDRLILCFEIVFLIIYASFIFIQINNKSLNILLDIRIYVIISYNIYALYTPVVFLIFNTTGLLRLAVDLNIYDYNFLVKSLFVSILFFTSFSIPVLLNSKINKKICVNNYIINTIQVKTTQNLGFYFWLLLFIISSLIYIYPYILIGFKEAISIGRWERYLLFNQIRENMGIVEKFFNLFFSRYLIIVSIFMMFREIIFRSRKNKEKIIFYLFVMIEALFLLFIDVRRRELMYIIIICFSYYVYHSFYKMRRKDIKKYMIYLTTIVVFFMSYQYYKNYFAMANKEGISYAINARAKESVYYSTEQKLYLNELGMVYENLLSSVKYTPKYFYGKTYLEAFIAPIPIACKLFYYDGNKTTLITRWQSQIYPEIFLNGGGLAFFPTAEAYLNIGYLGCIIFGFMAGLFFNLLYFKLFNSRYIVLYCMILPQGWNFSRISFLGVTSEIFWFSIYFMFYNIVLQILQNRFNIPFIKNNDKFIILDRNIY